MKLSSILSQYKADELQIVSFNYTIQKVNVAKRLVTGQVYAPDCIDSHGHFMQASELEKVAHNFLADGKQDQIDFMHDNNLVDAVVVESFIARGHPGWEEGAWVATTKINDDERWNDVLEGRINGYSFEIMTFKSDISVEIEFASWIYGETDPDPIDKHTHLYLLRMRNDGTIAWGMTSKADDGHDHSIVTSNITKRTNNHLHRIHLEKS